MKNFISTKEFFENKYSENSDPWNFATDSYELQRYNTIYNAISHQRYQNVFEPGCSIGVLSEKLSLIADHVQAFDISSRAVEIAKSRCFKLKNVTVRCTSITKEIPLPKTDLIIISEIGYYFEKLDLERILKRLLMSCDKEVVIVASHWLGNSKDHLLSGDEVHETINSISGLSLELHLRCDAFRLDRWRFS
jgi:hypothetical protein